MLALQSNDLIFASTRPVQIATTSRLLVLFRLRPLPPHAPCRLQLSTISTGSNGSSFASTRPVQIATAVRTSNQRNAEAFASTRPVQIATVRHFLHVAGVQALPPHAPCRLQHGYRFERQTTMDFASTRPVQIATSTLGEDRKKLIFASTRPVQIATPPRSRTRPLPTPLPPHAPCRLQRQKCTELQYTLFRTRVELVDSFSVLNKSMLR